MTAVVPDETADNNTGAGAGVGVGDGVGVGVAFGLMVTTQDSSFESALGGTVVPLSEN